MPTEPGVRFDYYCRLWHPAGGPVLQMMMAGAPESQAPASAASGASAASAAACAWRRRRRPKVRRQPQRRPATRALPSGGVHSLLRP